MVGVQLNAHQRKLKMKKSYTPKIFCPAFESLGHLYHAPDGTELISVTQVLKNELDSFRYGNSTASQNGTHGHKVMELYDNNDLVMETLDPYFLPHLAQYILALEIEKIKVLQNEVRRYSPKYMYAGTIDKIAEVKIRPSIIDIKLGIPNVQYKWQIASYKELMRHEMGADLDRYCLYLKKDEKERYQPLGLEFELANGSGMGIGLGWGLEDYINHYRENPKESYSFVKHTGKRDFMEFIIFLTAFTIKKNNKLIKKERR